MSAAFLDPRATLVLDDYVIDFAWAPGGTQIAIAGGEGGVFLGELAGGVLQANKVGEHMLGALCVVWQPGGDQFVSSGQDGTVALYGADGGLRRSWRPSKVASEHLAFAPGGALLAVASGKLLTLYTPDGQTHQQYEPLPAAINALAWDKPGRDLCAATHGAMVVIRPETRALRSYKWAGTCLTAAFAPNGKVLASGMADGAVHFWYLATAKDSQMRGYPGRVTLTSWDAAGRYLATGAGSEIVIWDFGGRGPEGSKPLQLSGHTDRIECLAFAPTGGYLVSGGRDWRLSLWQPGKAKVALDAHLTDSETSALRWSPDGRFLALGERKGRVTIYELIQTAKLANKVKR